MLFTPTDIPERGPVMTQGRQDDNETVRRVGKERAHTDKIVHTKDATHGWGAAAMAAAPHLSVRYRSGR